MTRNTGVQVSRNWVSSASLLVVVGSILVGTFFVAKAVVDGQPFRAMGIIAIAVCVGVYYSLLFYWAQGIRFFED